MLTLLLACRPPAPLSQAPVFQVVSPAPDSVQTQDHVVLLVRLTEPYAHGTARAWVDDVDVTDPLGLVRDRNANLGNGWDYVGLLDLTPFDDGDHTLTLELTSDRGRVLRQTQALRVDRPDAALRVQVVDPDGVPTSARVLVLRDGAPVLLGGPDADAADPRNRDARLASLLVHQGPATAHLEPGPIELVAWKGPRWGVTRQSLVLEPGQTDVVITIEQELERTGQLADLHVHTAASHDSFVPHQLRMASLAATDLDLVVLSDHERVTDLPLDHPVLIPGIEAHLVQTYPRALSGTRSMAHLNVWPLAPLDAPVEPVVDDPDASLAQWLQVAADSGHPDPVVQLNHPRGIQFIGFGPPIPRAHAYFNSPSSIDWGVVLDPEQQARVDALAHVDAVEVLNRSSWSLYQSVRQDWFELLDRGVVLTATGNSDSHARAVELPGLPANTVPCDAPDPDCLSAALKQGRTGVTTGPLVHLTVGDQGPGGVVPAGETVVQVRVQAASWVPTPQARVVVNGETVWAVETGWQDAALDHTWDVALTLAPGDWVIAEAGFDPEGPIPQELGVYGVLAPTYVPVGFTNPVFVSD